MKPSPPVLAIAVVLILAGAELALRVHGSGQKRLYERLDAVANALRNGDRTGANKQAAELAKSIDDFNDLMSLFRHHYAVFRKPNSPDHIEQVLLKWGRTAPTVAEIKKDAAAFEQIGSRTAAIALVAQQKPIEQAATPKARKDWDRWSREVQEGGLRLAAAIKAMNVEETKTVAAKTNKACYGCHEKFR
jgi:cytochrome c556